MSRQRTGSYFQRQSNISNVDQTPQRRVVLLRTKLRTAGPWAPCLGSVCLATWPPSPAGQLHGPCQRPQLATPVVPENQTRLWQLPPTKATHLPARHFAEKGTRCGRRFSSITRKNPRSTGSNQVTTKRVLYRNEKTQPTYTTRLTENIHKTTCRGLCVFPGDC